MDEGKKDDQNQDLMGMAIARMNGGFDIEVASNAIADTINALAKQAKWLLKEVEEGAAGKGNSKEMTANHIAMTMAKTTKAMDDTVRLAAFVSGKADSRPDTGSGILQGLDDKQLARVYREVEENEAAKARAIPAESSEVGT